MCLLCLKSRMNKDKAMRFAMESLQEEEGFERLWK